MVVDEVASLFFEDTMNLIHKKLSLLFLFTLMGFNLFGELERPNVIIIYGDDIGYGDVSAYGSKMIQTPFIDNLSEKGLRSFDSSSSL